MKAKSVLKVTGGEKQIQPHTRACRNRMTLEIPNPVGAAGQVPSPALWTLVTVRYSDEDHVLSDFFVQ